MVSLFVVLSILMTRNIRQIVTEATEEETGRVSVMLPAEQSASM